MRPKAIIAKACENRGTDARSKSRTKLAYVLPCKEEEDKVKLAKIILKQKPQKPSLCMF